jgi:uncharacterized protein with NAD-binding domain and iron-sulfur cluster
MPGRPDYIYTDGSPLQHTPMHLDASDMYGFFIKGDLKNLQASVDATLNRVAGRACFKALSPYVMVTFTRVCHAQSGFPADYNKGWGKEVDIITWVMIGHLSETNRLDRLFYYPMHIWVDVPTAISIGREIFGYPKNMCQYTMPEPGEDPLKFTLCSEGWQPYSPETQLAIHPILEVTAANTGSHQSVLGFIDLQRQVLKFLRSEEGSLALDESGIKDLELLMLRPRIDQLFLKQFPDGSGVKAVYQALVVAPTVVDKVHRVQLLGHKYECNLHRFDSFRLDRSLGFSLGAQPAQLPFHINFDFTVMEGEELVVATSQSPLQPLALSASVGRQKIAVLGGGVGAMSAAFHLTDRPGWQDRYDITVYQMGWRLGGKGASGRNADVAQRTEEHGLHIWFGFYDNAFALMQKAYTELGRPSSAPLATWQDAFKPQRFIALTEKIDGQWKVWPIETPSVPGLPGAGSEEVTLLEVVLKLRGWITRWLRDLDDHLDSVAAQGRGGVASSVKKWLREVAHVAHQVRNAAGMLVDRVAHPSEAFDPRSEQQHALLISELRAIQHDLHQTVDPLLDTDDKVRRLFVAIDLCIVSVIGMLKDGVLFRGFDAINGIEYRDWLRGHGASEKYTVNSAPVVSLYDLVFAYVDGDSNAPNIEAGTMLRGILRMGLAYHGAIMWKMQAGMGDTVFTPLYQVLKDRGVTFRFFHKVEELLPDADGVGEIVMTEQCSLADGATDYCPLTTVRGLDCWPNAPKYEQLNKAQADLLQSAHINLESHWSNWPRVYSERFGAQLPVKVLKRGVHFDKIVFGLSIGSLPHVCPQLLQQSPSLKAAADHIKTVATQSYQIWSNRSLAGLGWSLLGADQEEPVLSAFTEPFDTWASMDQLLVREDWPAGQEPQNVAYFCNAMPIKDFPPASESGFPADCAQDVKQAALNHLQREMFNLWPAVAKSGSFQWQVLVDPSHASGPARFDTQFWRANIDPSELYVLSVVGSSQYRLRSESSGFSNLYLAGDWLKTGLNAGCVEAAVMGGMQASRAISGYPAIVRGEHDG